MTTNHDHHPIDISTSPHLYPQAIQLKLYQAFIFSIPILFSIILFLLFYLFYLKRTSARSPPLAATTLPRTSNRPPAPASFLISASEMVLAGNFKERLPIILFDEDALGGTRRDSLCCVCLGEFTAKEELIQLPGCRHLFHVDCIHHWLCTNSTCPLCRSTVPALPTRNPCKIVIQPQPSLPPIPITPPPATNRRLDDGGRPGPAFQAELLHYNNHGLNLIYSSAPVQPQQSPPQTQQVIQVTEASPPSAF